MADKAFMSFTQNGEQVGLGHSLLVGGDTMEYRALVSDVAKKIIEDYAGSTLAGSAQSVQAALASLNSNMNSNVYSLLIGTAIASGANLNTYTTAGNFYAAGSAITNSLSNAPFTGYGFKMHVEYINSDGAILQTIISGHTPAKHYERRGQRASGAWTFSDWRLLF